MDRWIISDAMRAALAIGILIGAAVCGISAIVWRLVSDHVAVH